MKRLPRADAVALFTDWPHAVEVVPTHRRGWYRVTARGWVGSFATPNRTWHVAPKLGWEAASRLLTGGRLVDGADLGDNLCSALAARLAALMTERLAAGLVRGYADQPEYSPTIRGHIDFAATARRPGIGFAQVVDEFTTDQPWNGWPVAVAHRLMTGPLATDARTTLQSAVVSFADVRPHSSPPAHQLADRRLEGYRPLLDWCGLVEQALSGGGLLVNLERLFEAYLGRLLARPFAGRVAVPQRELLVSGQSGRPGVTLRPDLTVLDTAGRPVAVWDVKWKPFPACGPRPDDLHQALGYAAVLGVRTAGLVYPGRRFAVRRYDTPGGVTVTAAICRLTGDVGRVAAAEERLRRTILRV